MTLTELYEMQRHLDQIIVDRVTDYGVDGNDKMFLSDRITALGVEVSEFANEVEAFKYWKNNKRNDRTKQLMEYIDILHFWLSIGNTMAFESLEVEAAYRMKYRENIKRQNDGY
ncbi:dUTPase [Clostridium estertheticum]|uniref:dUTPase n=1 Tax=Clostridium estertheticum TaxID=238834 RepID=UPI001C6E71F0|nr:dUTPase [Clostridium estertheticum]MBW9154254.1 dUTPase [Clostridium estertheticum]WLC86683.1 dUTPase [Clostridium estertheticum]